MRNLRLVQTCCFAPEQYDVFYGDRQVGYIRVRWGSMWVKCPDAGDECVMERHDVGFGALTEIERPILLREAKKAILQWMRGR